VRCQKLFLLFELHAYPCHRDIRRDSQNSRNNCIQCRSATPLSFVSYKRHACFLVRIRTVFLGIFAVQPDIWRSPPYRTNEVFRPAKRKCCAARTSASHIHVYEEGVSLVASSFWCSHLSKFFELDLFSKGFTPCTPVLNLLVIFRK